MFSVFAGSKASALTLTSRTTVPPAPTTASISGSAARLELSGPFYEPGTITLTAGAEQRLVRDGDVITGHHGLCFEAAHFATLIAQGATESPLLPLDETVAVLDTIDRIRRQIGVIYPGE